MSTFLHQASCYRFFLLVGVSLTEVLPCHSKRKDATDEIENM
jgi:hypothetical protein